MILFNKVSKRYPGGYKALIQVNFHLKRGEMTFLTGHSGAGKSTLLRLIALIERNSSGQIVVGGQNLSRLPNHHIPYLRRKIGMTFQEHRLLFDRTVFDNVALPLVIAGFRHQEIRRRVRAALDKVGLLNKEKSYPITLSGGQQQRVGIARAVVNKPPILLADEPTGNLDPGLAREIMNLFVQFNQVGVTVLIASHALGLIKSMGYRTLIRKAKPSQQGHAWLLHHLYVLFSSLGRIARTPLPSLMTAAVIGIALALPTGLYLLLENVQQISNDWESVAQMSLFIKPEINDDAKINAFAKKLEQHPALKALEENPLPAVIVIQPASSEVEANQRLLKNLEQLPEVDIVQFDMLWLKRLFTIITIIRRGVLILAGLLSLAVLLVIGNTIRLAIYNRRDEIEIYKLVGATDTFIRRPFLYIGFWYGLFGGLIAWVLVNISLWLLKKPVKQLAILYESQFELVTLDALSSFILLFCGALLGLAGAWLAVGQHLKNIQPR